MPFGIGFIFLLMLVGGVAAYWGDRVGMLVGRRRLSAFGLRPKYTSRVVAVGTGVLIVLFTLTTLLIVSNSVRRALFGMDELQARVVQLSAEVAAFENRRAGLESRNEELRARSQELESETHQLEQEKTALNDEIQALEGQIDVTERELQLTQEQLDDLQKNLEVFRFLGEQVFNVAQNLYGANFEVRSGEVLDTFLIDVTGGRNQVIEELQEALQGTEQRLVQKGLGDAQSEDALRLDRVYQTDDGLISFSDEEVLAQAVQPLLQAADQGYRSVIVQLKAVTNARSGDPVFAEFHRFIKNEIVFAAGARVAQRVFDPKLPRPEIFEDFMAFVQVEIAQIARTHLLPPDGEYGQISYAEVYAAVDQIARNNRSVRVRAVAAEDIWAYDSLNIRFEFDVLK